MPDSHPVHSTDDAKLAAALVALSRLIKRQPMRQEVARWIVRVVALQHDLYVPIIGDVYEPVESRIGQAGRALLDVVRDGLIHDETHVASKDAFKAIIRDLRREYREIREAWDGPVPGEDPVEDDQGDRGWKAMTRQEKDHALLISHFEMVASEVGRAIHLARRASDYGGTPATRAALRWAACRIEEALGSLPELPAKKGGGMIVPMNVPDERDSESEVAEQEQDRSSRPTPSPTARG